MFQKEQCNLESIHHLADEPGQPSTLRGFSFKLLGIALLVIALISFASVTLVLRSNSLNSNILVICIVLYALNALLALVGAYSFTYGRRLLRARKKEEQIRRILARQYSTYGLFRRTHWHQWFP